MKAGQCAPTGGYFLMPEFYLWHDLRSAGPEAVGTYVAHGIWHASPRPAPVSLRGLRSTKAAGERLVSSGLWAEDEGAFQPVVTLRDLRKRRGHRGQIMLLSQMLPEAGAVVVAGIGGLGAWALAASWSLANCQPGYVPREAVRELGIDDYAATLCKRHRHFGSLWEQVWGGYRMTVHDGRTPERYWQVDRDDVRAPIPDQVRARVFARGGSRCAECGSPDDLTLDHIYPWSRGGSDDEDNLRALCRPCNSRKRAALPAPEEPWDPRRSHPSLCPECGGTAEYALDKDGYEFYLDPEADGGSFAALDDGNRIAWCRPAEPGTPLRPGEYLVSPHVCLAPLPATSDRRAVDAH
jgi:hypothetical protein